MKDIFVIFVAFMFLVNSEKNDFKFVPYSLVGEFKINFKALIKCDSMFNSNLLLNVYLNKISVNEAELKGNITLKMPLDDSLTLKVNMAVKDSIGGWKRNAHIFSIPKLCSTLKQFVGKTWENFAKSFGININCPIPSGVYVAKNGFRLPNLVENSPQFFYGTYKTRVAVADRHNKEHGCLFFIIEVKRLWET